VKSKDTEVVTEHNTAVCIMQVTCYRIFVTVIVRFVQTASEVLEICMTIFFESACSENSRNIFLVTPCLQTKKLQDRVDKCRKDVENAKDKYEEALAVLHKYNSTYVDDMTEVFSKTQDFEERRLRLFKDILIGVHGCLDISRSNE